MTDLEFYDILMRCFEVEPEYKRCEKCQLLNSRRVCIFEMKDEIRRRLFRARREEAIGFRQISMI